MAKTTELKEKTVPELKKFLGERWRQRFKLKLLKGSDELTQTHLLREIRREIARALTILAEKEGAK